MTEKPSEERQTGRRTFLKTVALLGASAALLAVRKGVGASPSTTRKPARHSLVRTQGYRLTPHINKYYERARF
jgi:nitrous oxide reductase